MPGFIGIIPSTEITRHQCNSLAATINLYGNCCQQQHASAGSFFAVSYLNNAPVRGARQYEDAQWVLLFAGDLISHEAVPFREIIDGLEASDDDYFKNLSGIFAIAAFDKEARNVYLISDRQAQHPLYYYTDHAQFYFSTAATTFRRLNIKTAFNRNWLWEYLFFNFPVGETSILEGVRRMPPGSILKYTIPSETSVIKAYAPLFRKKEPLLTGTKSPELAAEIFSSRVPHYFAGADRIASSLTGGWDTRTVLAFAPDLQNITTYTYGVPGCGDLNLAKKTAVRANLKHLTIPFDERFVAVLPQYIFNAVYYSSAAERILRSTLLYVYEQITGFGTTFPIITSGISFDGLFRGHALSPQTVSYDMALLFRGNQHDARAEFWKLVFGKGYPLFKDYIAGRLRFLNGLFGEFTAAEHALSYDLYCINPGLYGGEVEIANSFTTLRVPGWDHKISELAYSIRESALSFSENAGYPRGGRKSHMLQAYLLKKYSPLLATLPVGNIRPDKLLEGSFSNFIDHLCRAIRWRIDNRKSKRMPLEDWEQWLTIRYWDFIEDLVFAKSSRIRAYIDWQYLRQLRKTRDLHYLGKLATAEINLRLIENSWQKFW